MARVWYMVHESAKKCEGTYQQHADYDIKFDICKNPLTWIRLRLKAIYWLFRIMKPDLCSISSADELMVNAN